MVPLVEKAKQNTPSSTSTVMTGLAAWRYTQPQMLFILCGATGMRIGEALGLEIDKHISDDFLTISIDQKARHCKIEDRVKTQNSMRKVDIHPSIAILLREFVGEWRSGFLLRSRKGKPPSSSNMLKRHLHRL
jgi:integrase